MNDDINNNNKITLLILHLCVPFYQNIIDAFMYEKLTDLITDKTLQHGVIV